MHAFSIVRYELFLSLLIFLLLFPGCQTQDITEPRTESARFSVSMTTSQIPDNVANIGGELSRSGYETISASFTIQGDSAVADFGNIPAGVWHLAVTAYDNNNQAVYAGETNVNVLAGQVNIVHLTMDPVTGSLTVVVDWGEQPDFSGEYIFTYLANHPTYLYRYNFDTDNLEPVITDQRAAYPFLIPPLNKIGFVGLGELYTINPDGSEQALLFSWPVKMEHTEYSIVTERIYFYEITYSGRKLGSVDLSGGNLHYFDHPENTNNTAPAPSALNDSMLFASDRSGAYNIYIMDLGTKEVNQLTFTNTKSVCPVWDKDESGCYFIEEIEDNYRSIRYYSFQMQTSELVFASDNISVIQIGLSPDGTKLALAGSTPDETRELYIYDLTNLTLTQLTDFGQRLAMPLWLKFD